MQLSMQKLLVIRQLNISWRMHAIPEGRRQRYQPLECLALEESICQGGVPVRWLRPGSPRLLPMARLFEHTELSELAVSYEKSKLGFFMTFLHKHVLAAMGCGFVISALVVELPSLPLTS